MSRTKGVTEHDRDDADRLDLRLLAHGAVTLYWRIHLFEQAIDKLEALEYHAMRFRFERWDHFKVEFSDTLKWREQFGYQPWTGNLDALDEGLVAEPRGTSANSAICIENFQAAVAEDARLAIGFLDVIENSSRDYLMSGQRLICLVQTDDPSFHCEKLGGRSPTWNDAEWEIKSRKIT